MNRFFTVGNLVMLIILCVCLKMSDCFANYAVLSVLCIASRALGGLEILNYCKKRGYKDN